MIRSLGILGILLGSIAFIIMNPAIGVMMWTWVSIMNPHRLAYGFAHNFPVAYLIGGATILGWLVSKDSRKLPPHPIVILLIVYFFWTCITTVFAYDDTAPDKWLQYMKIVLFAILTMSIMKSRNRLHALVWMNVLCIGFFAIKGGLFTIVTGGGNRVWGPPGSFIGDNNALGLAMVMTLPLLRYIYAQTDHKYVRWGINGASLAWLAGILGTQSRASFVALGCMLIFLWLKSKNKLITGLLLVFAASMAVAFMPASFHNRMDTIESYDQDPSFMGRVYMWQFALKVARDNPILGGGFNVFYDENLRNLYLPEGVAGRAVHNVYFEVLGEHGYIGLALFMSIGIWAFFSCSRVIGLTSKRPDLKRANDLARMAQVSLVGYAVNGLTVNLATFDLYYTVLGIIVLNRYLVGEALKVPLPGISMDRRWKPEGPSGLPEPQASLATTDSSSASTFAN